MTQRLIYMMDPMCSWCWGFAPVIDAIQAQYPDLPLHLVPGGLRAGVTDPIQDAARQALAEHWQAVADTSGQPLLTPDALPAGFVYNTEPACRALVVAREDANVDMEYATAMREMITYMIEDPRSITRVLNIIWALRALERVGDHAKNIAEHVVYIVMGADVRHVKLPDLEEQVDPR